MNLLAIETSTDACSVALSLNGSIIEEFAVIPREHAKQILSMLDALLAKADISFSQVDALAFGCGPGSFTGLRIAASVIQGLAMAWDRPVVPISTLHALAQGAYRANKYPHIFSCLDARMGEVYGGYYALNAAADQVTIFAPEFIASPDVVQFPRGINWQGVGGGCKAYLKVLGAKEGFEWDEKIDNYPHAYDVAELAIPRFLEGEYVSVEQALPVYFREKVTG